MSGIDKMCICKGNGRRGGRKERSYQMCACVGEVVEDDIH